MTSPARSGISLAELLVALVLFGVVAAAVAAALDRQARFHDGLVRMLEARTQLAAAHAAVTVALRALAPADGDVLSLSDTAITFRMPVGTGVACEADSAGVTLMPDSIANGQLLTRFGVPPLPGDTAWLFDEGASPAAADDRWVPARLTSISRVAGACAASPVLDPVLDAGLAAWRLDVRLGAPAAAPSQPPTVVRITRHARFALYTAAAGGRFLGWSDWNAATGRWNVIQPVAGPFTAPRAAPAGGGGVAFAARDSLGGVILATAAAGAAAIDLVVRAVSRGAVRIDGLARGAWTDSLRSLAALRNRP